MVLLYCSLVEVSLLVALVIQENVVVVEDVFSVVFADVGCDRFAALVQRLEDLDL